MKSVLFRIALLALAWTLPGCGGGGGGGASGPTTTTLVVKALGSATTLYGIQAKVNLPAGVTLATQPNGELVSGTIVPSGGASGATLVTNYQTTTAPQTVTVSLTALSGFPAGEFLKVTVLVAPGIVVNPSDITFVEFKAYQDLQATLASGMTPSISLP